MWISRNYSHNTCQHLTIHTDTVSVIVQCALLSKGLFMEIMNYNSYSIGIIPEALLD